MRTIADSKSFVGGSVVAMISASRPPVRQCRLTKATSRCRRAIPTWDQPDSLELRDSNGTLIVENDNWRDGPQEEIEETTLAPTNDLESAIVTTSPSGPCTAIIRERNGQSGIGLFEYNLQTPEAVLCSCTVAAALRRHLQDKNRTLKAGRFFSSGQDTEISGITCVLPERT